MSLRSTVSVLAGSILALVTAPSVVEASCIPGFDYGAFSDSPLVMGGGAVTNSYDSSQGTYLGTVINSGGDVCTNATGADAVKFNGSGTQVYGNVCVGTGGAVPADINASPGQYLSSSVLPSPVVLTPVVVPTIGTYQGNLNITSPTVIPPDQTYGDVDVKDNATLTTGTYVMKSLSVTTNAGALTIGSGPVLIYISGPGGTVLDIKSISNAGLKATDLTFMVATTAGCNVKVNGGGSAAFALYAPGCDVTVNGNGTIYGAIVGKSVTLTGGAAIHYDAALKNYGFGQFECTGAEVSRASPVIATISGRPVIVQGTYEYPLRTRFKIDTVADLSTFRFPYIQGHLRASAISQFGGTAINFTGRTGANEVFDAATLLPGANLASCTPYVSTCRSVFTTLVGGANPPTVLFSTATASAIGAKITDGLTGFAATEWATLVSRIVAGRQAIPGGPFTPKLGGMDRSAAAVIPQSLVAGVARPTMVYVGGTDGMMHAFCGSVVAGVCDVVGRELWAYVPRVLLQELRQNRAVIDGSPRVVDMYGDFDGNGVKSFSTILLFTTGSGDRTANRTPAVYALDVTNPAAPKVAWEYTMANPAAPGAFELGHGQTIAAGTVMVGSFQKNGAFIQTNNGAALADSANVFGPGVEGNLVTALDVETGLALWPAHAYPFPDPVRVATNGDVPVQAVPGGVVAVDSTNAGTLTELVFGTIYGDLWVLDARTGVSKYGLTAPGEPLFRMSTDFTPIGSPPAIFSDGGNLYAVATTGSYWNARSSATLWNTNANQWIFAIRLKHTPAIPFVPFDEVGTLEPEIAFATSFGGGRKASTQALVVGREIAFLTDTADINSASYGTGAASTGTAYKVDLTGASTGGTTVVAGVGSLVSSGTTLYASGGRGTEQVGFSMAGTTGEAVNASLGPKVSRRLWLRTL